MAACAAAGGPAPAAAPTPTPGGTTRTTTGERRSASDVVRYGPSAVRYAVHRTLHIEQSYGGQSQAQDLGATIFLSTALSGPADTVGYPATFTIDSVVPDSGTPQPLATAMLAVRAVVLAGRVVAQGEFRTTTALDTTIAPPVAQLVGTFRDFLPRLPAAGAKLGDAWADTVVVAQHDAKADVERRSVLQSTAAAWEPYAGARTLRIETSGTYTVHGSGQTGGQAYEVSGAGITTGRAFVSDDGRFIGGELRDSATLTESLPMQGLTIPVVQVLHSTAAILPLP